VIPIPRLWEARLRLLTPVLLLLGGFLRVREYLSNRSIWLDESSLIINILQRTVTDFFRPLEFGQRAPLGFLAADRGAVILLGSGEQAMRLVPFLGSIASLVLFYLIGRRYLTRAGLWISLALFALCAPVVYYSSEVKQYSTDVAVALLLFLISGPPLEKEKLSLRRATFLSGAGAIAIWCSDPAVFVLAGIGLMYLIVFLRRRDFAAAGRTAAMGAIWITSFGALWLAMLRQAAATPWLIDYWRQHRGFMPILPSSLAELLWFPERVFSLFALPVAGSAGFGASAFAGLAIVAFLTGMSFGSMPRRLRWMLVSPIPFTLIASAMEKYPFTDRLLLFLIPSILLLVGDGASSGFREPANGSRRRADQAYAVLRRAIVVLLVAFCARGVAHPQTHHEVRSVLEYVKRHGSNADLIYGYGGHKSRAILLYISRMGFDPSRYVQGMEVSENQTPATSEIDRLRGHRAWVVFPSLDREFRDEDRVLLFRLQSMGPRLDAVRKPGAAAYLFDLRESENLASFD
jgi:hypothetical protein